MLKRKEKDSRLIRFAFWHHAKAKKKECGRVVEKVMIVSAFVPPSFHRHAPGTNGLRPPYRPSASGARRRAV